MTSLSEVAARGAKTVIGFVLAAAALALFLPWVLADGARGTPAAQSSPADPPVVHIESPAALAPIGSSLLVEGRVTAPHDVDRVEVRLDDRPWTLASGSARWSAAVDTSEVPTGEHVLHARATALDGRRTTASVTLVVSDGSRPVRTLLTGVVYEDDDRDGHRDAGEESMAGVGIDLLTAGGDHFASSATDETGRYSFTDLAPGTYRVAVSSASWWELRSTWVLTSASGSRPDVEADLSRFAVVDFGWRQLEQSEDRAAPVTTHGHTDGPYVEVFNDAVDAATIHDLLRSGSTGSEASAIRVQLGLAPADSVVLDPSNETHPVTITMSYESWMENGPVVLGHLYGQAWGLVHAELWGRDPGLRDYLTVRGLFGDSRLRSGAGWEPIELLAEDYRKLLGPEGSRHSPLANSQITPSKQVAGLLDFMREQLSEKGP